MKNQTIRIVNLYQLYTKNLIEICMQRQMTSIERYILRLIKYFLPKFVFFLDILYQKNLLYWILI